MMARMGGWLSRLWDRAEGSTWGLLFLTVGPPVLVIAAAVGWGWMWANGPGGWSQYVIAGALLLVVLALDLWSLLSIDVGPGLGYALHFALMLVVILTMYPLTPRWVMRERGETVACTLLEVDRQFDPTADLSQPELPASPMTYYVHRLDCPSGAPDEMTTTDGPAGRSGQRIRVSYDPDGRVDPSPAGDADPVRLTVGVTCLALATVLVRLGIAVDVIWARRRHRRSWA
jgi:hypothetical protein